MLRELVSAFSKAQQYGISHRDIKPPNLLIKGNTVKIGDFGSSTRQLEISRIRETMQGSPFFLSPELKQEYANMLLRGSCNLSYDPIKSDVYSLGVTFLQFVTLETLMELTNLPNLEAETEKLLGKLEYFPHLKMVLAPMLATTADARPTFVDIEAYFEGNKEYYDRLISRGEDCCEEVEHAYPPVADLQEPVVLPGQDYAQWCDEKGWSAAVANELPAVQPINPEKKAQEPLEIIHQEQPPPPVLLNCSKCGKPMALDTGDGQCPDCLSNRCVNCDKPIVRKLADSDIAEDLIAIVDFADRCCSAACLRGWKRLQSEVAYQDNPYPQRCIGCNGDVTGAPVIRLECGHICHDTLCLFQFLAVATKDFEQIRSLYECPACERKLGYGDLLQHFKAGELDYMKRTYRCEDCWSHMKNFRQPPYYCSRCRAHNQGYL
jgi:serine/threonine protein kinase/DNA-directed RNA polymerase subunit RPC12/RpoP